MPLLTFSTKKEELLNGTKIETTRLYTERRWTELASANVEGKPLKCWWKPRTKEKEHLFDEVPRGVQIVAFIDENPEKKMLWPYSCAMKSDGRIIPTRLTEDQVEEYVRNEGMDSLEEFVAVLEKMHGNLDAVPFIRIRFRDPKGA